jgi:hypothetical protein
MSQNLSIPQGMDPSVVNLARAIRKQEGGDYNNYSGDNATSAGAYQWSNYDAKGNRTPMKAGDVPSLFKQQATQYGLDPNDFSPKNQDIVAYNHFKALKDAGKNVIQIAAIHNGGDENRWDPNYVTKSGLPSQKEGAYNVPEYAKKVNDEYQRLKQATGDVSTPTQPVLTKEGIDVTGLGNVTSPEPSVLAPIVDSATKPFVTIGGGVLNAATQAIGGQPQATYSNPLGTQQDAAGYRNGQQLGAWDTAKQVGGAALEGLSYAVGGPEVKGALETGKAGILPYLKEAGKAGGKMMGLSSAGSSLQEGDSIPLAAGKGLLGYGTGYALGGLSGLAAAKYNKASGYSPEIFNNLDDAVRAGDTASVAKITSSPEYQKYVAANKYDDNAVNTSVKNIRKSIDEGIDNSYGVAKMTRTEKADMLTDDGIKAMLEHAQNTKNPIADTKIALENKANDLMDEALNPVIDKIRTEKLPLVPLDRQSLIDNFNSQLDKSYITDLDKQKIRDYVDTLINTQNKGAEFGVVDAGIIRRDANFDFTNPKNKGAVSRILGNTMRDALTKAENTATDPATKAIIAHINAVNKEYSRLMQGVDVVDLMARFPGQKPSELLNKAAGFFGAGASGNNPLAYLGAHRITNTAQNMMIRSKTGKLFGDLSSKSGPISSSELIGNAQRILNNVGRVSQNAEMRAASLSLPAGISAVQSTNNVPITIGPSTAADASRGFTGSLPLNTSLRGFAGQKALGAAAILSPLGIIGAKKLKDMGRESYQRESNPSPEPFMQPNVSDQTTTPKGVIDGIDISKYATDPDHEIKVEKIHDSLPTVATSTDAQKYIDHLNSDYGHKIKVTGDMIYNAAKEYGVSMKLMIALMQNDSMFGTTGLGKKTNNPGNIANDDSGHKQYYPTMREGVRAVARQLARYKVAQSKNS